MKKLLLSLIVMMITILSFAQCAKSTVWTGAKAEFLDDSLKVTETKNEKITVHTSDKYISVIHSDDIADSISGTVKEVVCAEWKKFNQDGKLVFKADLVGGHESFDNAIVSIEIKNGKTTIFLNVVGHDGKKLTARIPVDSYKEL